MNENIINLIKKEKWMPKKTAISPLIIFYNTPAWVETCQKRFGKKYSPITKFISYFHDGGDDAAFVVNETDYITTAKNLFANLKDIKKIIEIFDKDEKEFWLFEKELTVGNIELKFKEFLKKYYEVSSPGVSFDGFLALSDSYVAGLIKKYPKQPIPELIHPFGLTFTQRLHKRLLEKALSEDNNLEDVQEEFHWIHNNYKYTERASLSFFEDELKEILKKSEKEIRKELKEISELNSEIFIKNIDEEDLEKLNLLNKISWVIDRRKATNLVGNYWISEFIKKMCKKNNLAYGDVTFLLPEEFEKVLKKTKKLSDFQVNQRKKLFGVAYINNKYSLFVGPEAQSLIDIVEPKIKAQSLIKGFSAHKGIVRGIARVVITSRNSEFKQGEILVTSMTRPDFVPLMKKAIATVTDEGGVTCHASIVSRELGKPCVIGTKVATKLIKTGDLVEVDADKGIVRIIKKV